MYKQIFGYTCPTTPDFGYVGYATVSVRDSGFQIAVRPHRDVTGGVAHLVLPRDEAIALANSILEHAKEMPECPQPSLL